MCLSRVETTPQSLLLVEVFATKVAGPRKTPVCTKSMGHGSNSPVPRQVPKCCSRSWESITSICPVSLKLKLVAPAHRLIPAFFLQAPLRRKVDRHPLQTLHVVVSLVHHGGVCAKGAVCLDHGCRGRAVLRSSLDGVATLGRVEHCPLGGIEGGAEVFYTAFTLK